VTSRVMAWGLGVGLALVFVVAGRPALAGPTDQEIREQASRILADPAYDSRPPEGASERLSDRELERSAQRYYRRSGERRPAPASPSEGSSAMSFILFAVIAIIALAVAFWLAGEVGRLLDRRRAARAKAADDPDGGGADRAGALERLPASLAEARRLAADGRFDAAVRALLRGAIETVAVLSGQAIAPPMTSREVLRRADGLDGEARGAFGDLVAAVEVSLFGGEAVDPGDYQRCERAFEALEGRLAR